MHVEWYGQSAFRLRADDKAVFVDPFADLSVMVRPGMEWSYPPIAGVDADLVLVTRVRHRGAAPRRRPAARCPRRALAPAAPLTSPHP